MHVLYIHQYFCTRNGRSGTRSYEFAKYLVKLGHRVTMVTSASDLSDVQIVAGQRSATLDIEGIRVIAVAVPYSHHMGAIGRAWAFLRFMLESSRIVVRERHCDVVFATSTPLTVAIPGMIASVVHRRPMVFEVRDLWPEAPIQLGALRNPAVIAALRWLERTTYRRSHRVVALSPGIRDGIVATGYPATRVDIIPNCSDLDLFTPGPPDPAVVGRYGLQDAAVVTHAGSMGDKNGLEVLIDAAAILQQSGRGDIKIVLVGEGRSQTGLRNRIESLGLSNVVFTGGVARKDVAAILRSSDVCLCLVRNVPILATCSPNKLFDALAAGRPVIVNIGGWMRDLVETTGAGVYAAPDSPADLAAKILEVVGSADRRRVMGAQARRIAEQRFDRQKLAAQFETVLADVAGVEPRSVAPAPFETVVAPVGSPTEPAMAIVEECR
jgi:glycosyltransferase involved in cell wall biosynthesis